MYTSSKPIATLLRESRHKGQKRLAVLLDPDKVELSIFPPFLSEAQKAGVDMFLVGGSLITHYRIGQLIEEIRTYTNIPAVLFPGSSLHIEPKADAILLLSLISGRNPELLIGQHVVAAPLLRQSGLEILPTGYMLIDGGKPTTVSYISNTIPIPRDKASVAACTAIAGEMLGLQQIYLDAGSGALLPVPEEVIEQVRAHTSLPIIVGGGINDSQKAWAALAAGADMIVVGNALESNPALLHQFIQVVKELTMASKIVASDEVARS